MKTSSLTLFFILPFFVRMFLNNRKFYTNVLIVYFFLNEMCLLAFILYLPILHTMSFGRECYGKYGIECCSGFKWNSNIGECEKCPNGYTGTGCVLQCEYPSYGERCQYECRCESALCDPANGCYVLTTEYSLILEDQRSTVNFQQYTTLKNLYEYQSITSSQMNISIHPQLVAGSYQAVLIASVSSIVLFAFVVSVLICLRNVKLQNWMTTNTANTHESGIATVEEGLRNMQEENRHLNSFESQDFPFVNEQVSSLYEEIKENSPGHEKKAEHIYLPISENEELNDDRVNDNDMDSYISPVNVLVDHKRHITGSKLYEGGYITPI